MVIGINNISMLLKIVIKIKLLRNFEQPLKKWLAPRCFGYFNYYNIFLFKYLVSVKKYEKLNLTNDIKNGIFEIFIKSNGKIKEVVKIPKRNNVDSLVFYYKLRKKNKFKDYYKTLVSLKHLPYLNKYILEPKDISRNGGYKCDYIEGFNLKYIKNQILYGNSHYQEEISSIIICKINGLLECMKMHFDRFGYIPGDWPLHNLIYDINKEKIVNVDLEGFYTYKKNNLQNNLKYLTQEFNELINLLDINKKRLSEFK